MVGDSASDNVLGYNGTTPIELSEMIPFGRAVVSSAVSALVVVDLPFGSYEVSDDQALTNSIRVMKETGADAVKLEGAKLSQIRALASSGIPVMGHVGFTPQSVNTLAGYKVQGRTEQDAARILQECKDIEAAGAFAVVLEMTRPFSLPSLPVIAPERLLLGIIWFPSWRRCLRPKILS